MSLSLCMIVKNGEATLSDCLESVREVADELVLVDLGSTDRTVDIAGEFGATILPFGESDDLAAARNEALRQARGDWILVLEADEVLTSGAIPVVKQAIQEDDTWLVANLVRQESGSRLVPYALVSRLFRKHPDIKFSRPFYESIDDSVLVILSREPHWKVVELVGIAIRHNGSGEAIAATGSDRNLALMQDYLAKHPGDPYVCSKLGSLYLDLGESKKGIDLLQRGLQASQIEPMVRYELHFNLAYAFSQRGDYKRAEKQFQAAVEQPISAYLKLGTYNNWGNMRMRQKNPVAAQVLFQKVVEIDPNFALGFYNLATALKATGNLNGAVLCYQRAIELDPTDAESHQGLGVTYLKGGRVVEGLDSLRRAIALYQQQGSPEAERLQQVLTEMHLA